MSFDRLQQRIDELKNPTVVGLDPALEHIPPHILRKNIKEHGETLWAAALSVFEFNAMLINAINDIVPAVKPQLAFYEALGTEGVLAFEKTCKYAKRRGLYVICDGKRGDIGSTAEAYSAAYLGEVEIGSTKVAPFDADALTINAYLGSDGVKPFLDAAIKHDKALFALVKTSNPSAGELQDLAVGDGRAKLYEKVGEQMELMSLDTVGKHGFTRIGAVVGATYPHELLHMREKLSSTFFLVPGYGAQGGGAADASKAFRKDGRGAIVNSSRSIIAAWKKTGGDYVAAARDEALRMREELRDAVYS